MDQVFQSAIDNLDGLYGISLEDGIRQLHGSKIQITVRGSQHTGSQDIDRDRPPRHRTIRVTLSAEVSQKWVNDPSWDAIWDAYGVDLGDGTYDDGKQSIFDASVSADIAF